MANKPFPTDLPDPLSDGSSPFPLRNSIPFLMSSMRSWLGRHPEIWVTTALFIASNLFAATFEKFAHWQLSMPHAQIRDFCRWDCTWFRSVVDEGYDLTPWRENKANWGFFPLFPLTALAIKHSFRVSTTALALVLASKAALYTAILSFLCLLRPQLEDIPDYLMAGSLVAFNPYVVYAHAGYSEPLYFSLATISLLLLGKGRWLVAGTSAAALAATRMVGCFFSISYLIVLLKQVRLRSRLDWQNLRILIGFLLCPLGFAVFLLYLYQRTGDALAMVHIQVGWGRVPGNPFMVITRALQVHGWSRVWGLMALCGLACVLWLFKVRRPEFAVFLAAAILVPLSADTWGFARYLWWQPPFLYVLFDLLKRHRGLWPMYLAFASGMAGFMIFLWFSGTNVVI